MKKLYAISKISTILSLLAIFFSLSAYAQNTPIELVRLELTGQSYTDEIVIYTDSGATFDFDGQYDAIKIPNFLPGPTFSSISTDQQKLHINAIPPSTTDSRIPLSVVVGVDGGYSFNATELTGFSTGSDVFLVDSLLQVSQSLFTNPTYSFNFTTTDQDTGRFYLNFVPGTVTSNKEIISSGNGYKLILKNTDKFQLLLTKNMGKLKDIHLFDLSGKVINIGYYKEDGAYTITPSISLSSGIYIVSFSTTIGTFNEKIFISDY